MEDAYEVAEQIIDDANNQLENNKKQWNQEPLWNIFEEKPAQCVPFRYALSGVFIHCDEIAMNTPGWDLIYFKNNFGVNISTEFNGFFVEHPSANGQADALGGTSFTSETFQDGVINHEMGHILNLRHTFDFSENLNDTPWIRFKTDYNCDGDTNDNWSTQGGFDETVFRGAAWSVIQVAAPMDYDNDGNIDYQNPCNPGINDCLPEPHCSWDYTTNNIMSYTKYVLTDGAFTENQITKMLEYISTDEGCEYIEEITNDICSPPMANLHILPTEASDNDCGFCFHIEASVNESFYELEFFDTNGNIQYTTGFRSGEAQKYCITAEPLPPANTYKHGFLPGLNYPAKLTVENDCGDEAIESISFILPPLPTNGCYELPGDVILNGLYPNPFTNQLNIEYKISHSGYLETWLFPANTNSNNILLDTEYRNEAGTYSKSLNTAQVPSGIYYLILDLDGQNVAQTTIRI